MIGKAISHYRIIKGLGAGGMGEVYLAEDTTLGRRVALKILPPKHTQNAERLRRFKQEAKSASALNHPNILIIHEVGEADGHHFIATEFVEGETLREALKRTTRMQTGDALAVAIQVASALSAAHAAGIVHRDIKPENIMLRGDGYVKVLDFGLAKLTQTGATDPDDSGALTLSVAVQTESGMVLGTAQYMSPEQAAGKPVDARSDIFSFGSVLYEMISGKRAFDAGSVVQILSAIIEQEPGPLPSSVPPDLSKIIQRCLRKDPARRYQTIADVKAALEDFREEWSGSGRGISAQTGPRRFAWIGLTAILMIALLLGWFGWRARRGSAGQDSLPLNAVPLTTLSGIERAPSLSPDGNYVAFSWTEPKEGNQNVYVQMIGSGSPLALTKDPRDDYNPVWSPDGKWIAFLRSVSSAPTGPRDRELLLKPPLGGPERKLAEIRSQDFFPAVLYLAWAPSSDALVVTDSPGEGKPDALFVVRLETGEKKRLTNPQSPVLADTSPAISPDGRSLVFLRRTSWGSGELHLLSLGEDLNATGQPTRLTPANLRADYPAWMPDSQEILFAAKSSLWRLNISGQNGPSRLPFVGEDGSMPVVSRAQEGKPPRLVYVRSFVDTNIWRIETAGPGRPSTTAPVQAIASTKHEYHCEFSPDGRRVAFSSGRSGEPEIWVADPDGSNAVQLTTMKAQETMTPRWSHDGKRIAFASNVTGEFDIYVVSASGGKPSRLTSHPAIDINPTFLRDGQSIYFASMRTGDYRIWKMSVQGGDATQITPDQGVRAFEMTHESGILYLTASIVSPVWQLKNSGGKPFKALEQVLWFNFCLLDKRGAYYIDRSGTDTRLQYLDFGTGKSQIIARNLGEVTAGLTTTPDGKTVLFSRVDSSADDLMLIENFK